SGNAEAVHELRVGHEVEGDLLFLRDGGTGQDGEDQAGGGREEARCRHTRAARRKGTFHLTSPVFAPQCGFERRTSAAPWEDPPSPRDLAGPKPRHYDAPLPSAGPRRTLPGSAPRGR